ncbi:PilC/PilY family type IV pilus protein [Microbulbifer bruguierae]|uniref:PilC/PilY family type IV pilus protein n=1 Tax=Microbulbifer bruguierae TaxID=3029061 RepID=A0ABY8NHA2_9GAMM|nr:PilC/PilY family type IV pilus protein [Microbulbifer bruguierae]WGL18193.1 PilC/PilY family type IV pilus protein [Microbulbifer bruguierae]
MRKNKTLRRTLKTIASAGFTFAYTLAAAESVQIANTPLQATGTVQPNLMILLDSSLSMNACDVEGGWACTDTLSDGRSRLQTAKAAVSDLLDSISDESMRVGFATFDGSSGAKIRRNIDSLTTTQRDAIKTQVSDLSAGDFTPLAESVMDIGRYFTYGYTSDLTLHPGDSFDQTESTAGVSSIFSSAPAYVDGLSAPSNVVQAYCQKNFMLLLTDGEPTEDRSISDSLKDYAYSCPEADSSCKNKKPNADGSYGDSYAFSGSAYLRDVAAALYDMDLRPDLNDYDDNAVKNNVTSYFVGFADGDLADNQLLKDAGANGGGSYIYANNAASLADAFNSAIGSIANSIGSQSSVSFNSTSLDIGSVIYSAQFDTSDNSGRLYARSMNADTGRIAATLWDAAEKLAVRTSADRQIITSLNGAGVPFTASALRSADAIVSNNVSVVVKRNGSTKRNVQLVVDSTPLGSLVSLNNDKDTALEGTVSDTSADIRIVCSDCTSTGSVTIVSATLNGVAQSVGVDVTSEGASHSLGSLEDNGVVTYTAHRMDLQVNAQSGNPDDLWEDRLNYIRGDTSKDATDDFRRRGTFNSGDASGQVKLLGDIVHSTPIYVGKPELNWSESFGGDVYTQFQLDNLSRTPMVYVGANDGMLHGLRASDGVEIFAYIPSLLLSNDQGKGLHAFTSPAYNHRYYVDQTPTISDVYITPRSSNSDEWRTVLVGGLRGGGKGYFALDITNPDATGTDKLSTAETNAANIVMWEFDGGDATDRANMGLSFSEAQIAKLNNGKWAAIFGNGYESDNGVAGLFVVYIEEGMDGWSSGDWKFISTGVGATGSGRNNGLSSPRLIDLDGDNVVDRVYAGDMRGNMWAFDLESSSDANWQVDYSGKPLFSVGSGEARNAITAAPMVARNTAVPNGDAPNVLVMFGTGQYLAQSDLSESTGGNFYAVWDKGTSELDAASLALRTPEESASGRSISSTTLTAVDWSTQYGWYMSLKDSSGSYAAERVVSAPALRRNTLFFNTIIPNPQPCASSGTGWLMSLDFRTGLPEVGLQRPVADFNNDGEINLNDSGYVGKIFTSTPCTGEGCGDSDALPPGMPGQPGFIGEVRCTPGSAGDVICDDIDVGKEEREGRLSWEEVTPD